MNSRFTLVLCQIDESEYSTLHNFRSVLLFSIALHIHVVVTPYTLPLCRVYRGKDLCVFLLAKTMKLLLKRLAITEYVF